MDQPVYIIGHKNPDTDSICASLALAELKQKLGVNAVAARIGHVNPETKFILEKTGVQAPVLMDTAKNTLGEIEIDDAITVDQGDTLRHAWDLLIENNAKTLFAMDKEGNYSGLVTLGDISKVQMQDLNITKELLKDTPIENLRAALKGEILLEGQRKRSGEVRIADKKMMDRNLEGAIMVLNDHEDSMIKSMAKGCAVILIAENFVPNDYIIDMARNMGVTLINTPYNLMKIIQMVYRSIPVESIMLPAKDMVQFDKNEYLEDVEREMLKTRHSSYPVVQQGKLVGSVARYHLLKSSPKQFILVDHNEKKQTINDIEKGEVVEIVDHHRIGDIQTSKPIVFRNMIVGSSSTIVGLMFEEYGLRMSETTARLVAYAMISDTMNFNSPTCTQIDKILAAKLEVEYNLDLKSMADELFQNTASIKGKTPEQILNTDCKEFELSGHRISVSQVFVFDNTDVEAMKEDLLAYMNAQNKLKKLDLMVLACTNIEGKGSKFLAAGPYANQVQDALREFEEQKYVSRKKQIVPGLARQFA
jgi:manganese-dependent inorganic pyrophosphatase